MINQLTVKLNYLYLNIPYIKNLIANLQHILSYSQEELYVKYIHSHKYVSDHCIHNYHNTIHPNNYVNLGAIKYIGFDYDYTIANYRTQELNKLIYDLTIDHLVNELHYPKELTKYHYNNYFAIRGLSIDRKTGLVLKISHQNFVVAAYDGLTELDNEGIRKTYIDRFLSVNYKERNLKPLNDLFALSVSALTANVIDYFNKEALPYNRKNVLEDLHTAVEHTHTSGILHQTIMANREIYIKPNHLIKEVFNHCKQDDKKIFIITNSTFNYLNKGMQYLVGDDWRDYFEYIICDAYKPKFYTEIKEFREIDPDTGYLLRTDVQKLHPGKIYNYGCISKFKELSEVQNQEVLYIGDSIYSDLYAAKREHNWKTCAVVHELGYETSVMNSKEYQVTYFAHKLTEQCLRLIQDHLNEHQLMDGDAENIAILEEFEHLLRTLSIEKESMINPHFGSVIRARHSKSIFGYSLFRHCDLYLRDINTLLDYSLNYRFYPKDNNNTYDMSYSEKNMNHLLTRESSSHRL